MTPDQIADRLTVAQKECLIAQRRVSGTLKEWQAMISPLGLINHKPNTPFYTPLGLQVRDILTALGAA